ncbi:MAG: sigma-70 family RNA polymerase sigma factor [Planctomycetota bacterium]|jgi:DNA-directed RNA polymerase specialized sigma24 family protein
MEQQGLKQSSRLRMSLAACALVVATTAADPAAQAASGGLAAATAAGKCVESVLLDKVTAYCARSWQNAGIARQDWNDCTQEVYLRLLSRIRQKDLHRIFDDDESPERRELNRAIWATAQRWRRAPRPASLIEEDTRPERVDTWPEKMETLSRVERAMDSGDTRLTPTQRQIVKRWTDGESISGIADALDMTPARVSDEKYKAVQKLRHHFGTA